MTETIELRRRGVEIAALSDLKGNSLIAWRASEIAQRVLALIGLQVYGILGAVGDFQAQVIRRKRGRGVEIGGPQSDVADLLQLNHVSKSSWIYELIDRSCGRDR